MRVVVVIIIRGTGSEKKNTTNLFCYYFGCVCVSNKCDGHAVQVYGAVWLSFILLHFFWVTLDARFSIFYFI